MTIQVDRSARNISPAALHPVIAGCTCGGSLVTTDGVRRLATTAYRTGIEAGYADALAHLGALIRDLRSDLQIYRSLRNRAHRELSDYRVYDKAAGSTTVLLGRLFQIRRALKEGAHR